MTHKCRWQGTEKPKVTRDGTFTEFRCACGATARYFDATKRLSIRKKLTNRKNPIKVFYW